MPEVDLNKMDLNEIKELIRLKKEKPEEYKKLLNDMKGVFKDIAIIIREMVEEIRKVDNGDSVHDKFYQQKRIP